MSRPFLAYSGLLLFCLASAAQLYGRPLVHEKKKVSFKLAGQTEIFIPEDFKPDLPQKLELAGNPVRLQLFARSFSQGNAVYVEIEADPRLLQEKKLPRFYFNDSEIPLVKKSWGYRAFFAIDPEIKPGKGKVRLDFPDHPAEQSLEYQFDIAATKYQVSRSSIRIPDRIPTNAEQRAEAERIIQEEIVRKKIAFEQLGPDALTRQLAHPRDMHHITSPFWARRIYSFYRRKKGKRIITSKNERIHRGVDLRAYQGTPIYAMANGRVVLAEKMHYEGNYTVIDHGNHVFTSYMHQTELFVKAGDEVRAGQLIGTAGATGRASGAHLHLTLTIHGVPADPLSLLSLPVRD